MILPEKFYKMYPAEASYTTENFWILIMYGTFKI